MNLHVLTNNSSLKVKILCYLLVITYGLHLILLNSTDLCVKLKEHIAVFILLKSFCRLQIITNSTNQISVNQHILNI